MPSKVEWSFAFAGHASYTRPSCYLPAPAGHTVISFVVQAGAVQILGHKQTGTGVEAQAGAVQNLRHEQTGTGSAVQAGDVQILRHKQAGTGSAVQAGAVQNLRHKQTGTGVEAQAGFHCTTGPVSVCLCLRIWTAPA
eukprot:723090-Pelagomonas_calceolata.AAC.1